MADSYDHYDSESGGNGFVMGLITGTVLGAGLGMLLAPKAGADMRGTLGEQARHFGTVASEQYRRASETATHLAERGRDAVGRAREAVSGNGEQSFGSTTPGTTTGGYGTTPGSYGAGTTGGDFGRS